MIELEVLSSIKNDPFLAPSFLDYPLPLPHKSDKQNIKAFVLGADPSNVDKEKKTKQFKYVFDIEHDARYFRSIKENLLAIGLTLDQVYVQNMVRNYMDNETQKNSKWALFADKWLLYIKQEFDSIDPGRKLPVFVTAEIILKYLLYDPSELAKPIDYYCCKKNIPIAPPHNKLNRNIVPFYRHRAYSLLDKIEYRNKINNSFK